MPWKAAHLQAYKPRKDANVKSSTLDIAEVCGGLQFPLAAAVSLA